MAKEKKVSQWVSCNFRIISSGRGTHSLASRTSSTLYPMVARVRITGSPQASKNGTCEKCLGLSEGMVAAGAEAVGNSLQLPTEYGKPI